MTSIHEYCELDRAWTTERIQSLERGTNGSPGVEHIIHENYFFVFREKVEPGGAGQNRFILRAEVIAEEFQIGRASCRERV